MTTLSSFSPSRSIASLVLVSTIGAAGIGCQSCGQTAVCSLGGPINDPSNRTLRRDILSYGLGEFCKQMTTRNAPLKMSEDTPAIGRFFPRQCHQRELENGDLLVQFEGEGYAWTNLSKKVSFASSGTVHYSQDFKCSGDTMYAYFPVKAGGVQSTSFNLKVIEQPVANLMQNWITPFADNFGRQMLTGKLGEGFTVIREPSGGTDFAIGILALGTRPQRPFQTHGSGRLFYESQRIEIHQNQRDFVGPILIEDGGRALFLRGTVEGMHAVDLFVINKDEAETSLRQYLDQGMAGPLAFPPMVAAVVQAGVEYRQVVPVAKGMYYVVIDNTPSAGSVAPPTNTLDDRAAVVNYAIEIGDTP